MDLVEATETIKSYSRNPLSFCFRLLNILLVVVCCLVLLYFLPELKAWCVWVNSMMQYIFYALLLAIAIGVAISNYQQYSTESKILKEKANLYDEYVANRTSLEYNNYRVTEVEDDYNNNNNIINNSSYKEIAPAVEAVQECHYYGVRAVEEVESKSYRRTRSKKKGMRMMESERVSKTASWRSETMDGLNSEEYRMSVETFITEKKKMLFWQNSSVDQWQNSSVDQWQNGSVDQRQNGVVQWLSGVSQLQNGVVDQWQNGMVPWQGSLDDGTGHRHQNRSQRLVEGFGSNGYNNPYLAISY